MHSFFTYKNDYFTWFKLMDMKILSSKRFGFVLKSMLETQGELRSLLLEFVTYEFGVIWGSDNP